MDIDKIKELMELMVDHDVAELSVRNGEEIIELRRGSKNSNHVVTHAPHERMEPVGSPAPPVAAPPLPEADPDAGLLRIASPMVGTFYASPKPDAPPFVQVGGAVHADTVVCIIEAMKVFNEIKADVEGVIARVVAANASPVEYGQPLFLVQPPS